MKDIKRLRDLTVAYVCRPDINGLMSF